MANKEFLDIEGLQAFYNKIMDMLSEKFIYGRETVVRDSSATGNYLTVQLNLPFTATNNTHVIATVEVAGTPAPFRDFALVLLYFSGRIYATVSKDYYADNNTLPSGTYYINWLVLDKG